jgi:hypothetical protein
MLTEGTVSRGVEFLRCWRWTQTGIYIRIHNPELQLPTV